MDERFRTAPGMHIGAEALSVKNQRFLPALPMGEPSSTFWRFVRIGTSRRSSSVSPVGEPPSPPGEGLRRAAAGNGGTGTRAIVQHLWGSPGSIHEGEMDCTTGIPFGHHASVRTYLAMTTEIRKLLHWSTDSPRPGLRRDTPPHKCGGQVYTQERYRAGEGQ